MRAPERPATAYIGLGSNLGDPRVQVGRAIEALARLPGCTFGRRSSLYCTTPVGPIPQPEYVNAVVSITTGLTPLGLLAVLQGIEHAHGRVRDGTRWGPRTLDLDLLLYDDVQLSLPKLILPHPELANRAFVLVPLVEIAPTTLQIPGLGNPQDLLAALMDRGLGDRDGVRLIPADGYATPIPPVIPGDQTSHRPLYS